MINTDSGPCAGHACSVFECTNILFQITSLNNDIHDAKAATPDLSASRAIQTMFLYIPGTTQGIFLCIIFGTTAASRKKVFEALIPSTLRDRRKRRQKHKQQAARITNGGTIKVETSLTITSGKAASMLSSPRKGDDDVDDENESSPSSVDTISLTDLPQRSGTNRSYSTVSFAVASARKPLPAAPPATRKQHRLDSYHCQLSPPTSRFRALHSAADGAVRRPEAVARSRWAVAEQQEDEEAKREQAVENNLDLERAWSVEDEDDYHRLGTDHSDDSGPILPIQRPEVRFALGQGQRQRDRDRDSRLVRPALRSKSFSRPR